MQLGDIVRVNYFPGSRYIIKEIINNTFIVLEGTDSLFWESEISLHEDQIKLNRRIKNLQELDKFLANSAEILKDSN